MEKDLFYLTLSADGIGCLDERIILKDKLKFAAEELVACYKNHVSDLHLYINEVSISICGILIKGNFFYKMNIQEWL